MAERQPTDPAKRQTDDLRQRDAKRTGKTPAVKDIPDESKERHTEIAVETGERLRHEHEQKP